MELWLVRHAIAYERDPERWPDDGVRLLTPEGVRRFRRAARGLKRILPKPDIVLASPLLRAAATAKLLHEVAGWPAPVTCAPLAASGSLSALRPALRAHEGAKRIALVGHEPFLSGLLSELLAGPKASILSEFKKGGFASVTFEGAPAPGGGALRLFLPPRLLRAIAR